MELDGGLDSLAFSADGMLLAGGSFMRLALWEINTGKVDPSNTK